MEDAGLQHAVPSWSWLAEHLTFPLRSSLPTYTAGAYVLGEIDSLLPTRSILSDRIPKSHKTSLHHAWTLVLPKVGTYPLLPCPEPIIRAMRRQST